MFKPTKLNGQYSKSLDNGSVEYYFDDGMVFARVVVNSQGEARGSERDTFIKDSKPWQDLAKLAKKQHLKNK